MDTLKALKDARKTIDTIWCMASEHTVVDIEVECEKQCEKLDAVIEDIENERKKQMNLF